MRKLIILFVAVLFCLSTASAAVLVVDKRLFITTPDFWDRLTGKAPKSLKVVARITNNNPLPIEVKAMAEIVTLDADGRPVPTGEKLLVEPEVTTTYPNRLTEFSVLFPVSPGTLAFFYVLPAKVAETPGIKLQTGAGFTIGAVWADKYAPQTPGFTIEDGYVKVSNRSSLLMRFSLIGLVEGKENENTPFFLEAGKTRLFPISVRADAYVLDWLDGEKRLGIRLRPDPPH